MSDNISLSAGIRSNLLLLQQTNRQIENTQLRLATGNRVNSALDGPNQFFQARGLTQRAGDLSSLKDAIGQSISTIQAADKGISAIERLVEQARGITSSALSNLGSDANSIAQRRQLAADFNTIKAQIDALASDSGYGGKNLVIGNGFSLGTDQSGTVSVTGLSNVRVTNATATDDFTVAVTGDGSITGNANDIANAQLNRGLFDLRVGAQREVDTVLLTGTYAQDDTVAIDLGNGRTGTYTITAADVAGANAAADRVLIAASLADFVNTTFGAEGFSAAVDTANTERIRITGPNNGESFTTSVTPTTAGDGDVTVVDDAVVGGTVTGQTNFDPISIEVRGNPGQARTVVVSQGNESRSFAALDAAEVTLATPTAAVAGTTSVAEVDGITLGGGFSDGDTIDLTVAGTTVQYTVAGGPLTSAQAATALANFFNTDGGFAAVRTAGYTAAVSGTDPNQVLFTGLADGTNFTVNGVYANTGGGTGTAAVNDDVTAGVVGTTTAQQSTITFAGTYVAGETVSLNINDTEVSYTVTEADVVAGNAAQTRANVATGFNTALTTALGTGGITGLLGTGANRTFATNTITLDGATDGTAFTLETATVEQTAISTSFSSGATVSFTVDRNSLERLGNSGSGTSRIETNVNLAVTVTNSAGLSQTRSAANASGNARLAQGENAFAFETGTVRLDVNQAVLRTGVGTTTNNVVSTVIQSDATTSNDLTVQLNESNTNTITVAAQNVTTGGQGLRIDFAQNDFRDRQDIERAIASLDFARNSLRSASQSFSTNLNIIQTREDYTTEFINTLTEGAGKLTLADQNEEGANLLALQTRQQLGTISLSLANQSQQAILRLF